MKTPEGPLTGVLVIDLTRVLAGPYATMVMADLGARVVKVEGPGGDDARGFGPVVGGKSTYFESLNRGKESIVLDLKAKDDRAVFEKLVARADVLVENYRAGAMEKLGYGWEVLQGLNQRLVYAAISGFGQSGPYRNFPAYDMVVQGMGGIMSITGNPGAPPVRVGTSVGDITAGLFGLTGILSALHRRRETGRGCMVDVGMLDCQVAILENAIGRHLVAGESPGPLGMRHPSITPFEGFKVGEEYLIIAAGNDSLFVKLCGALGKPELARRGEYETNVARTENHAGLRREIEDALAVKSAAEWLEILRGVGVPCAPINTIEQVVNDAHVAARNMIIHSGQTPMAGNPIKISGHDDPATRPAAPELDGDREEILRMLD